MIGTNCHNGTVARQDHRFLVHDQNSSMTEKFGLHIVRNEDMDSIYHADGETDDAHEEFHGNTVHFIA
jgi:hypothetical protein